jgi:hypothetical protein
MVRRAFAPISPAAGRHAAGSSFSGISNLLAVVETIHQERV